MTLIIFFIFSRDIDSFLNSKLIFAKTDLILFQQTKMSKQTKIGDDDQESQYGYVHAVSGPGNLDVYTKALFLIHFYFSGNC